MAQRYIGCVLALSLAVVPLSSGLALDAGSLPEFEPAIRLESPAISLGELADQMSARSGVPIKVMPSIRSQEVSVPIGRTPVSYLLDDLADRPGLKVRRVGARSVLIAKAGDPLKYQCSSKFEPVFLRNSGAVCVALQLSDLIPSVTG